MTDKLAEMGFVVKQLATIPEDLPTAPCIFVAPVAGLGDTTENLNSTHILEYQLYANQEMSSKTMYLFKLVLKDL